MKESLKVDEEKQSLLYSESFPLNEKNERKKIKPISQVHKLLSGVKLNPDKVYYKPLAPEHYEEVKILHKEWFPVPYPDSFFESCVLHNNGQFLTLGAFYKLEEENKEIILGTIIIICTLIDNNFKNLVGENVIDQINKNIGYEEEVKFCFSKLPSYISFCVATLGVIDECRRMNIGSKLLKDAINYVAFIPFGQAVYLNVIDGNFSGIKFYEKNGLTRVNKIKDYYTLDEKKYD